MNIKIIKEKINDDIKIIYDSLIFSEYQAKKYRNYTQNEISYIVIHNDCDDYEYISCLLLNINIFDYYDGSRYKNFSMNYLKEFGLFHYNGFLGVVYNEEHAKNNIIEFFEKYGCYFINDYKQYEKPIIIKIKDHIIQLYDEILNQIKVRDNLNKLFWDK